MTKQYKMWLVFAVVWFLYSQLAGIITATFGITGSVTYNGWAGYFIGVGITSIVTVMLLFMILAFLVVIPWMMKEKDERTVTATPD